MIRFKDRVFEDYFIDPVTAVITDKDGNVQETTIHQGRFEFKKMSVHRIQAHTAWGYKKGYDVHHIDENPLNNALSNLVYLTRAEHMRLHMLGNDYGKGFVMTDEVKKKISESHIGEKNWFFGKHHTDETKEKIRKALKGKPFTEDHKRKIAAANMGHHLSEETKQKIREAALRRRRNEV